MASIAPHPHSMQIEELLSSLSPEDVVVIRKSDGREIELGSVTEPQNVLGSTDIEEMSTPFPPYTPGQSSPLEQARARRAAKAPQGEILSFDELQYITALSPETLREAITEGIIPYHLVNGQQRFNRSDISVMRVILHERYIHEAEKILAETWSDPLEKPIDTLEIARSAYMSEIRRAQRHGREVLDIDRDFLLASLTKD